MKAMIDEIVSISSVVIENRRLSPLIQMVNFQKRLIKVDSALRGNRCEKGGPLKE
jgi:hypothetical protein